MTAAEDRHYGEGAAGLAHSERTDYPERPRTETCRAARDAMVVVRLPPPGPCCFLAAE